MNAYQLAAMRLLLNRNGRHNWSIAPDTEFPEHWTVRDQNGNMAMQLEQWPEGRVASVHPGQLRGNLPHHHRRRRKQSPHGRAGSGRRSGLDPKQPGTTSAPAGTIRTMNALQLAKCRRILVDHGLDDWILRPGSKRLHPRSLENPGTKTGILATGCSKAHKPNRRRRTNQPETRWYAAEQLGPQIAAGDAPQEALAEIIDRLMPAYAAPKRKEISKHA